MLKRFCDSGSFFLANRLLKRDTMLPTVANTRLNAKTFALRC
jgi:hypothetical protein